MRSAVPLLLAPALLLAPLLAGCSGPGDAYPEDYVATEDLPGDLVLMSPEHPSWPFVAGLFGMDENPDDMDPSRLDLGEGDAPQPEEGYVVLYVRASDEQAVVFGAVGRFASAAEAREGLDAQECSTQGPFRLLRDGRVGVSIGAYGDDPALAGYVDGLAQRVAQRTGATTLC